MRFLLLGRHRETGEVRLLSEETFPTRQDALDHLPGAMSAGDAPADHDLFVVDLDVAVPVVFVQTPATVVEAQPEPVEAPVVDVWEAPAAPTDALAEISAVEDAALEGAPEPWTMPEAVAEAGAVPESAAEPVAEEAEAPFAPVADVEPMAEVEPLAAFLEAAADEAAPAAPIEALPVPDESSPVSEAEPADVSSYAVQAEEVPDEGGGLADALRRAASHLESQGIVEPPSVEEFAAPVAEAAGWLDEGVDADVPAADETPTAPEPEEASPAWPWESVAAEGAQVEEASAEAVAVPEPDDELDAILDGIADVPDGPDFADVSPAPAEPREPASVEPPAPEPEPFEVPSAFEPVGIDAPGLEDITLLTPVQSDSFDLRPVIIGEYAETSAVVEESPFAALESIIQDSESSAPAADEAADPAEAGSATAEEAKPYEPGEIDISTYTCQDCVYVETCPKANQDGPATCGSFQWTSV